MCTWQSTLLVAAEPAKGAEAPDGTDSRGVFPFAPYARNV
jgi:hypothetical protein